MKWLNLQTTHCNLTEKCLKWHTSCDLQKLLTAVSTSVSAAAAFIQTRRQQFLKKCQMTESTSFTLQFDRKMSRMTNFFWFFTKFTYYCVHFRFRCYCFYSWAAILKKKCRMTESTNFTLQFDRKLSQMSNFLRFFTKVTYCCVHFRFRYCCFYSNPWAAILANV